MDRHERALASTLAVVPSTYTNRISIMTTPEKEKMMDAHYHQMYAHKANEHCAEREEQLKAHCKKLDRNQRSEFQEAQSGITNQCAAESQARVDDVVSQGHQAIGEVRQQDEEFHIAKVGEIIQQAEVIHQEKIGEVVEQGKAAIAQAQHQSTNVINQAEQQILLARQEADRLAAEARDKDVEQERRFADLLRTTETRMQ